MFWVLVNVKRKIFSDLYFFDPVFTSFQVSQGNNLSVSSIETRRMILSYSLSRRLLLKKGKVR